MDKDKLAKIASIILGPAGWFPVLIILLLVKTGLFKQQILILFPSLLILQILFPLGILCWLVKQEKVSDWDIRIRQERYKILTIFMTSTLVAMMLVYFFGSVLLFHLYLILWLVALAGMIITYFWKISLHMMLNVNAVILVNFLFGWKLLFLYLLIPIIGVVRYYHKHHTMPQILIGVLVSGLITFGMLKLFGY